MKIRARVLIAVLAGTMLGGFAPSASRYFRPARSKKNMSPYAYLRAAQKTQETERLVPEHADRQNGLWKAAEEEVELATDRPQHLRFPTNDLTKKARLAPGLC